MALTGGASKLNIGGLLKGTGGLGAVSQLNPVTAGISAIPALFQAGLGISQEIKADKLAKSQVRPVMGMPGAQQVALANAQNLYGGEAPGIGVARQQLAQSQAGSAANIMNSGGGNAETLAALTRLDQNAGDQGLNLAAMQEQWKAAQAANLQSQLMQAAETQNRQFMYNQDEPYRNAMKASQDLHDAAPQNIFNALTSVGGSVASALGTKKPGTPEAGSPSLNGQVDVSGRQQPENFSLKMETPYVDPAQNQGEGPQNGLGSLSTSNPAAKGPAPKINTSGTGEPIPFMGSTETGENEIPALKRDLKTGNFDPKVYDPKTGKPYAKNTAYSSAAADPNARIFGVKPTFNPNQGMESYDFNNLSGLEKYSPNAGPYPTGYDPTTGKMSQVAGPQDYNPEPMAPGFTPLQASAPDLTTSLGSSATPSVLGGAYNSISKIFDKMRATNEQKKKGSLN